VDNSKYINYRWVILILAWMMLFMHSLMLQSIPPIMTTLANDVGLTYTQLGSLMGAAPLGSLILAIPGGIWADRLGSRRVVLAALLLYVIGISMLALSQAFETMLVGRLISGSGAAMLFVVAPMSISEWFKGREIGFAMGLFNIAGPVGVIFSFNIFGMVVEQYSWRVVIWLSAIAAFIMLLATLIWFRELGANGIIRHPGKDKQSGLHQSPQPSIKQLFTNTRPSSWLLSLIFFLYSAGIFQVMTIGPAHFEETLVGFDKTDLVASLSMVASIFLSPVIGRLIDITGKKDLPAIIGLIGCALFLLLIPTIGFNSIIMMLLLGVFIALILPALYAYPADIVQPGQMGFVFGLISATFGIGISSGSFVVGWLRDVMGDFDGAFIFMALLCVVAAGLVVIVERQRRKLVAVRTPLDFD